MSLFKKKVERRGWNGETETVDALSVPRIVGASFAGLLALVMLLLCVAVVGTGEVAVVTRFGNVVGTVGQGIHLKAPVDRYNRIDVSQQQVTETYSTATFDKQSLDQEVTAQVTVSPDAAEGLYRRFLGNHMDGIVRPVLSDGFKAATAEYSIEQVVESRGELSASMLERVRGKLAPYGIEVVSVEINNVALPEEYKAAVERQKVAERDKVTAQVEQETAEIDAETNRILAESLDERNFRKMFLEKWNGTLPLYMGDGDLSMMLPAGQ